MVGREHVGMSRLSVGDLFAGPVCTGDFFPVASAPASALPQDHQVFLKETTMGSEDIAAGKAKQIKGKINDVAGAVKGDTGQQIKGKLQKGVGKLQEGMGKLSSDKPRNP
jgi:uncharacterized protein YjbJ (UPF0337 family)